MLTRAALALLALGISEVSTAYELATAHVTRSSSWTSCRVHERPLQDPGRHPALTPGGLQEDLL